jgi:poly(3-hydroxybutyrate) depolymerase
MHGSGSAGAVQEETSKVDCCADREQVVYYNEINIGGRISL